MFSVSCSSKVLTLLWWLRHMALVLSLSAVFIPMCIDANQRSHLLRDIQKRKGTEKNNGVFVQIPYSNPPTVRPPPYTISSEKCPGNDDLFRLDLNVRENWEGNLCGDLNKGVVPQNPMGHVFRDGGVYPFEAIKNKSLDFFRKTLPILKTDKSLPKVARFGNQNVLQSLQPRPRGKRAVLALEMDLLPPQFRNGKSQNFDNSDSRNKQRTGTGRSRFCEGALGYYNRLCKLYNAMWGKTPYSYQQAQLEGGGSSSLENRHYHRPTYRRRPDMPILAEPSSHLPVKSGKQLVPAIEPINNNNLPPTPCPSSAEYLTPVFARNHEGAWRYVVQIPREGYFTQTVEVTKCLKSDCFYMDGYCKTSPRWQSLLVAEMFYPDTTFPTTSNPPFATYLNSSMSSNEVSVDNSSNNKKTRKGKAKKSCDGYDNLGCYQVRLFYDWFLIPGSCKCWRRKFDFTNAFNTRSPNNGFGKR